MKFLVLFLLVAFILIVTIILLFRKRYTREKFAFHAFSSLLAFAAITVIPLIAGHSFLSIVEDILRNQLAIDVKVTSNLYDKFLSIFIFISLVWLALRFHSNWHGPISERSFQNKRRGVTTGMLEDAIVHYRAITTRQPIPLHKEKEYSYKKLSIENTITFDHKRRISTLLMAYSDQYKIDPNSEWYSEYSCFITKYGKENVPAVIFCPSDKPSDTSIRDSISLAKNLGLEVKVYTLITKAELSSPPDLTLYGFSQSKIYSENELLDKLINIPGYRDFIIDQFETKRLTSNSDLTLSDIYVPSSGTVEGKDEIDSIEDFIVNWANSDAGEHIALLGEYGQGKSTLSYKLAYDYYKSDKKIDRLPIVIELRGKSPRTMSIEELLFSWAYKFGLNHNGVLALHEAGRLLLILEGFDEIDFVGDTEIRLAHFRSLWQFATFEKAKILITGRPNFFFDTKELKRALLLSESDENSPSCRAIRLNPFNKKQIKQAIRGFPENIQQSLLSTIDSENNTPEFNDLLSRPSTLFWAANIWDDLLPRVISGNILSASVIGSFLFQCYDRQKNKKLETTILAVEREFFTIGIAVAMHRETPGANQISAYTLRDVVEQLMDSVPDALVDFTTATETKYIKFKDRIKDPARRLETVLTDVRTCGVIVEDISRPGYFRFAHKSFYEYLVSLFFAYSCLLNIKDKELTRDLNHDKNAISVQVIRSNLAITNQTESNFAYSMHEISQFTGQIFTEKILKIKEGASASQLFNYLFPGILRSLFKHLYRLIEMPFPSIVTYAILVYMSPFFRLSSLRLKIWFYACQAMNYNEKEISNVVGKKMTKILLNRHNLENHLERRVAYLLGIRLPIDVEQLHSPDGKEPGGADAAS